MGIFKAPNFTTRAEKISSFTVSTAEYGSCVMELFGTTRISGNVLYYDDFTAHEHRETHRSGKGGGGKTTTITYTYTAAIILGLCEGPVAGIGKVWIDKDLYTYPHENIGLTLFSGTPDQEPWGYVTAKHPEKALPYACLAYMAGVADLGSSASLPNYNFEVKGQLLDTGDGVDVNPADYILYILNKVGMSDAGIVGIDNYRAYCKAANLLISTPSDATEARAARDIINEIASLTNAYIFWSNDTFKIVPREDRAIGDWKPNNKVMYDLTPDDFLAQSDGSCVSYSRKDSSELYNRFSVEFLNRENAYAKESVSYEDTADIAVNGVKQANTISANYIYTKTRAVILAEAAARRNKYERNKYTFKLGWAFCRLEVGDMVTLTDTNMGLDRVLVMIDSLTESATGELTFTAIGRPPMEVGETEFDVHENERPYINFNFEPGFIAPPVIFQPDPSLMYSDNELWIAAKGQSKYWGGCNIWVSNNDNGYRLLGQVTSSAQYGELASDIAKDATELEVSINGQLISGSADDAENGDTLLWCDEESFSYTTAELLDNGNYKLSGLVRGQYNSDAVPHKAGAKLVRCDDGIFKTTFLDSDDGKTVYFKFTSFNIFMGNEQSLADVPVYQYIIRKRHTFPPNVTNLDVEVLHNGQRRYYWDFEYPKINNISGFRMKYIQGSIPNWERGFEVQDGLITVQPYETNTVRQGVHTIMIKAVNSSGNESKKFASVLVNFAEPLEDNVLYRVDFAENDWEAVETDGSKRTDGYIHSTMAVTHWVDKTNYYWDKPAAPYWGAVNYKSFVMTTKFIAPAGGNFFLGYDILNATNILYKIANKDNIWKQYATKFDVRAGDEIQLKIAAPAGQEETVVKALMAVIDVPDREEHFENITVPEEGIELPIVTPNYQTTAVRVDSITSELRGTYQLDIVSRTPCMIRFYRINNDAGWSRDPVAVVADVTWQGFEKEVIE